MSRSWGPGSALPRSGPQSLHPETSTWPHGYSDEVSRCPGSRVWLRMWRGLCPFHRLGNRGQESKGGPWGWSRPGGPRGSQAPPLEQAPTAHTCQLRGGCWGHSREQHRPPSRCPLDPPLHRSHGKEPRRQELSEELCSGACGVDEAGGTGGCFGTRGPCEGCEHRLLAEAEG